MKLFTKTMLLNRNAYIKPKLQLNSTQQDITDVGADTSYVRIYIIIIIIIMFN